MDFSDFNPSQNTDNMSVKRFEEMLRDEETYFFDVNEFEDIIDYYLENNKINIALKAIKFASEQHPGSSTLLLRNAQLCGVSNKFDKALTLLNKYELLEPSDAEIYITRAMIFSKQKKYKESIAEFKKALRSGGEDKDELYVYIACEYQNMGRFDQAIPWLQKALEENPDNTTALFEIAFSYEILEDMDTSIAFHKKFIDEKPYSFIAWHNLGIAYNNLGLHEKALDAFDYTIAIKEDFVTAYISKATAYECMEEYHQAIDCYKKVLKYDAEEDVVNYYNIAECYFKLDIYNEAFQYYKKAIDIDSNFADAWFGLGLCQVNQSKLRQSIKSLKKAIAIDNQNADYWYSYGNVLQELKLFNEAKVAYSRVTELNPDDEEIWFDYYDMLFDNEEFTAAIELLKEGILHHTENSGLYYELAGLLISTGKFKEGYNHLTKALNMNYSQHEILFLSFPQLRDNPTVIDLVELYK